MPANSPADYRLHQLAAALDLGAEATSDEEARALIAAVRQMAPGRYRRRGRVLRYAAQHAPVGGVTIGGKEYRGGEFIPGGVLAKATPEERAKVEGREETEHEKKWKGHGERKHQEWEVVHRNVRATTGLPPMAKVVLDYLEKTMAGEGSVAVAASRIDSYLEHGGADLPAHVWRAMKMTADLAAEADQYRAHAGKHLERSQYEQDVAAWEQANAAKEAAYNTAHDAWEARGEAYQERRDRADDATGYDPKAMAQCRSDLDGLLSEYTPDHFDPDSARDNFQLHLDSYVALFDESADALVDAGATEEEMAPLQAAFDQAEAAVKEKFDEWLARGQAAADAYKALEARDETEPPDEPDDDALEAAGPWPDHGDPKWEAMVEEIYQKYGLADDEDASSHPKSQEEYERRNQELEEEAEAARDILREQYTETYDAWVEKQTDMEVALGEAGNAWGETELALTELVYEQYRAIDDTVEAIKTALTERIDEEESADEEPEGPEYDEEPEEPDDEDLDEPEEEEEDAPEEEEDPFASWEGGDLYGRAGEPERSTRLAEALAYLRGAGHADTADLLAWHYGWREGPLYRGGPRRHWYGTEEDKGQKRVQISKPYTTRRKVMAVLSRIESDLEAGKLTDDTLADLKALTGDQLSVLRHHLNLGKRRAKGETVGAFRERLKEELTEEEEAEEEAEAPKEEAEAPKEEAEAPKEEAEAPKEEGKETEGEATAHEPTLAPLAPHRERVEDWIRTWMADPEDRDKVEAIRADIRAGKEIAPAILKDYGGGDVHLIDGSHRAAAFHLEGKDHFPAITVTPEDEHLLSQEHKDRVRRKPAATPAYDRDKVAKMGFGPSDLATLERLAKANGVDDLEAAARAAVGIARDEMRPMSAADIQRGVDRVKAADAEGAGKPDGVYTDSLGRRYRIEDGKRVPVGDAEEVPADERREEQPADGRRADVGGADGGSAGGLAPVTGGRIVTARAAHTKPADPEVVPAGIREHLNEHQVQGVATAITALDEHGGFLLADGTGVGKTRQQLAVALAAAQQGKKVLIVTKAEVIKPDWKKGALSGSFAADSETMGVGLTLNKGDQPLEAGTVHVSTYDRLGDLAGKVDGDTLVIFDESHALKNWGSARAKHGHEMAKAAGQVMYATATPADKPLHIAHLFRAQVFGGRKWSDTYEELGMHQVSVHTPNGTIQKWEVDPRVGAAECYRRMSGLFDRMTEDGLMLKREISFEGVDVGFQRVEMPPEAHEAMARIEAVLGSGEDVRAKVEAAYDRMGDLRRAQHDIAGDLRGIAQGDAGYRPDMREEAQRRYREVSDQLESTLAEIDRLKASSRSKNAGLARAQVLMHQRRQQETFKIPHAVEATLADLAEGRQVVLFASRVSESGVGEKGEGGLYSEGTAGLLRKALEEAGVPAGDIADLHGGVTPKKRKEAVEAFQSSKAKVIIATVESGGTGINLDDVAGDRPRTMIMMTAPFSAVENVQAAGRVWRLKTQSAPRLRYLFGDTEVDDWNASLIAGKMKALGAAVGGQVGYLDVPDLDVSPEEEVERMTAGKAKETTPYAWPRLTRTKAEKAPVRLTGNTFAHKAQIRDAGGKWEGGAWVLPKHVADTLRHLSGVEFSDTPRPAPPPVPEAPKVEAPKVEAPKAEAPSAPTISTRKVNTARGERHVHGFAPSQAFWDARKRGRLPDNVTVRKDDRTGRWEASIWGATPEEVARTRDELKQAGHYARDTAGAFDLWLSSLPPVGALPFTVALMVHAGDVDGLRRHHAETYAR